MMAGFQTFIASFSQKLRKLQPDLLLQDTYPQAYLQELLQQREYYLQIYSHVLQHAVNYCKKQPAEISLVDYGCGNGLLGIFAKHCGFKKVYLVDVSNSFIHAAQQLAGTLHISVDGFITGDVHDVAEAFATTEQPDAVVGTDVIEHIYNLEDFFTSLYEMNTSLVTVFTTASVTSNRIKSKKLEQLQYRDEYVGSNPHHAPEGHPYAGASFLQMRTNIILQHAPMLDSNVVDRLAAATRGMNKPDIIEATHQFKQHGTLPQPPKHPTNTCDPITGSWTERLLKEREYETIYNDAGFSLQMKNGFYNQWQGGIKGKMLAIANNLIKHLRQKGNTIAPFITLVGKPKGE